MLSSNRDGDAPPILYSFRRCPYAIRARLALKAAGIAVELREVVLRAKPAALIAASAKATVPVLQLSDGTVVDESFAIMHWALARHDPMGWVRADEQREVQALVDLNDGPFKQALDRCKYAQDAAALDTAIELLQPLNARLARHRFLLRDTPSLADIALLPFVRQFAAIDRAWFDAAPWPALRAWLDGLVATPLFESVMPKFAPWQPGDAPIVL